MPTSPVATILIVDDEIQNRKLFEAMLQREGYLTLCAVNGEEGLALSAQCAPDLILLDIMMPGMDGYQVASLLKANPATANIPIIAVTANIDRSARLAGLKAGAEEFLTKPIDLAELLFRVRNLLRLKTFGDLQRRSAILEQQVQARTADLQRFRTAMDATADAIMLVNRRTMRFVEVNATACKLLGYTREELFEMGPVQLGAAKREQMESVYGAVIAVHIMNELTETRLRHKDGSHLEVEVRRHAQLAGADWIIVSVVRDITERKQMEEALRESERFMTSTIDALSEHICVVDGNGKILAVNKAWRDFACANGVDPDMQWVQANYLAVCDQAAGEETQDALTFAAGMRAVASGERVEFCMEYTCHSLTERRWFSAKVTRFPGGGLAHLVIAHESITRFKQAEKDLLHLAHYDSLTGLPNRTLLKDRLHQVIAHAKRNAYPVWVLFLVSTASRLSTIPWAIRRVTVSSILFPGACSRPRAGPILWRDLVATNSSSSFPKNRTTMRS